MERNCLLTADEAAKRLKVSRRWVYRRAAAGDLPTVRLGNGPRAPIRVDEVALHEWLRAASVTAGAQA